MFTSGSKKNKILSQAEFLFISTKYYLWKIVNGRIATMLVHFSLQFAGRDTALPESDTKNARGDSFLNMLSWTRESYYNFKSAWGLLLETDFKILQQVRL